MNKLEKSDKKTIILGTGLNLVAQGLDPANSKAEIDSEGIKI